MKEAFVKQILEDIKAQEIKEINQPSRGDAILYRLLLMIYDELGTMTETQRHLIDALYDIVGAIKKEE